MRARSLALVTVPGAVLSLILLGSPSTAMAGVGHRLGGDPRAVGASAPPGWVIEEAYFSAPQGEFDAGGSVSCPTGTATWGGGTYFVSYTGRASINTTAWNESTPGGWQARVNNPDDAPNAEFSVQAVCAKKPKGYQLVSKQIDDPASTLATGTVTCPTNKVIISGGVVSFGDTTDEYLLQARPISRRSFSASQENASTTDEPFVVEALCAKKPAGYMRTSASFSAPAGQPGSASAVCPANTSVISGGFGVSSLDPSVLATGSSPTVPSPGTTAWFGEIDNLTSTAATVYAYAICAR